jgi:hypothetical protein
LLNSLESQHIEPEIKNVMFKVKVANFEVSDFLGLQFLGSNSRSGLEGRGSTSWR